MSEGGWWATHVGGRVVVQLRWHVGGVVEILRTFGTHWLTPLYQPVFWRKR